MNRKDEAVGMKTFKSVIPWLLLLLLVAGVVAAYMDRARKQAELSVMEEELAALEGVSEELKTLRSRQHELERLRENKREIESLREETGRLQESNRTLQAELEEVRQSNVSMENRLQAENQQLRRQYSQLKQDSELADLQQQIQLSQVEPIGIAMLQYAEEHEGNLPKQLAEVKPYLGENQGGIDLESFEILTKGKIDNVSNPAEAPWARQKKHNAQNQEIYSYLDGNVGLRTNEKQ
jgi:septal ring factor EnvC (AmiA/AmiB activator)